MAAPSLPHGVVVDRLEPRTDHRGTLREVFRTSSSGATWAQANVVTTAPRSLRGVHVHLEHGDHLVMLDGRMVLALHDCRRSSATFDRSVSLVIDALAHRVTIPVGVAHGFWFPEGGTLLYGLDGEWSPSDDLGCRWDDPALGIDWSAGDPSIDVPSPTEPPLLSARDTAAGPLASMIDAFDPARSVPSAEG